MMKDLALMRNPADKIWSHTPETKGLISQVATKKAPTDPEQMP